MLHIGLVQMRCPKGAIAENLASTEAHLREAATRGVDILCFPEMSITGYIDPDRWPEAVLSLNSAHVARFVEITGGCEITAIAGIVEGNPRGKPFITQLVARAGHLLGVYRKTTLGEDEAAWFAPGDTTPVPVFTHRMTPFGVAICADIDSPHLFAAYADQGARVVFEAAAPGLYGEQATRDWQAGFAWWRGECRTKLARYARDNSIHIAVATQAGRTVDEDFPGGGYVFAPDGRCVAETVDWSAGVLYARLPVDEV